MSTPLYNSIKYGSYLDIWLATFARTPHPFNHDPMRDSQGNLLRPSLSEAELLDMQNATQSALTPEEQDIYDLITRKRKKRKGEVRPNTETARTVENKYRRAARLENNIKEDYTPRQINAVKRKHTLRPKALGFKEPSTVLPDTTKGDEFEKAYKSLKDPIVKSTLNDISRLDRYKRQVTGSLKPHERTLPPINRQDALNIQKRLQAARASNPDTFNQLKSIHTAINNTAKNPGNNQVVQNIPGHKDAVVKALKDAGNNGMVTPSYVNNPESIAYAGNLKDSRVQNLNPEEINKAKRTALKVQYTPKNTNNSALQNRISMIENVGNTLDEPLPMYAMTGKGPVPRLANNVLNTVTKNIPIPTPIIDINIPKPVSPITIDNSNPYRQAILQNLSNPTTLPLEEQRKLAMDSLNQPTNKPNAIQNIQNKVRAALPQVTEPEAVNNIANPSRKGRDLQSMLLAKDTRLKPFEKLQTLSRNINPPQAVPVAQTPITPDPMGNPFESVQAPVNPKPKPIVKTNSLEERIAERVAKRLQNEQAVIPPKVESSSLIGKWRSLPRESRGLAKIGAGIVGAGGLLLAQNALANSISKKRQVTQDQLQRQQMLYNTSPIQQYPEQYPYQ